MKQIALGNTRTEVGAVGLGCLGMSHSYGQADREQSFATLQAALDEGIQFLDTADTYGKGHNEELIGEFFRRNGRGNALIATKFGQTTTRDGARAVCNDPAYIAEACDASLRRLGVEAIDLYFMHRRDPAVPLADSIGAMARLVEAGKVRWLGISEVSVPTLREAHAVHPMTALESEYSLWTRDVEGPVLDACRELGVTFVAFSPLSRAFLTGTLELGKLEAGDTRTKPPRFNGEAAARNMSVAAQLPAFAAARGVTPAQIALAWLLAKNVERQTVLPIPGTKRPHYVRENAAAAKIELSAQEVAELDAMFPVGVVEGARYTPEEEARTGT